MTVGFGLIITARIVGRLEPQLLFAVTEIFPDAFPNVTLIEVVPCPELIVEPTGTLQVYEVAPTTGLIEKFAELV